MSRGMWAAVVLLLAGAGLVAAGVALLLPAAGLVTGGVELLVGGYVVAYVEARRSRKGDGR